MQAAVQAQSFQAKAISLEKAAEASSLQAQAVVHAHSQAEAQAQAQKYVAQANQHAHAHAQASIRADHLQRKYRDCVNEAYAAAINTNFIRVPFLLKLVPASANE